MIHLLKDAIDYVDITYSRFIITNCEIITINVVNQWAFKSGKRMLRSVSENTNNTVPFGYCVYS